MIPLVDAQEYVLDRCVKLPLHRVGFIEAQGAVTANAVVAPQRIPPFDNTAVDGFAVQASDTASSSSAAPSRLKIVGTIAAGDAPTVGMGPGEAIRIMTGAPLPAGADAVVMVERTETEGDDVLIEQPVSAGDALRYAGEDLEPGDAVFDENQEITPGHLGVLASIGSYEVDVYCRPVVGVFSNGDELIEGPQPLEPGQIRDSNRHALLALLRRDGFDTVDLGIIADDAGAIKAALVGGVERCDALVTSAGVSMGDFDYVRAVLDEVGDMRWMQVAIKPAKPLAFGLVDGTPVFGLPGNPVSSMVSYELFARPGLRKMMGHVDLHRPRLLGSAAQPWRREPDGKTHFVRVNVDRDHGIFRIRSAGGQGSHQLTAMAGADALAVLADGEGVEESDALEFFFLN